MIMYEWALAIVVLGVTLDAPLREERCIIAPLPGGMRPKRNKTVQGRDRTRFTPGSARTTRTRTTRSQRAVYTLKP
ncbi:hypothetical protein C8Q78DRAFT_1015803, partial [Trametes maxima]